MIHTVSFGIGVSPHLGCHVLLHLGVAQFGAQFRVVFSFEVVHQAVLLVISLQSGSAGRIRHATRPSDSCRARGRLQFHGFCYKATCDNFVFDVRSLFRKQRDKISNRDHRAGYPNGANLTFGETFQARLLTGARGVTSRSRYMRVPPERKVDFQCANR